jgi:SPP1 gp7 family putative phage head morphogenesis protein
VRPSPRNEVWYRARLLNIVKTARLSVEPQLRAFFKAAIKPENQVLAHHVANTARNMIDKAANEFKLHGKSVAIASAAAKMNLQSVDRQVAFQIKRATGVDVQFPKPQIPHEAITDTIRLGSADTAQIIQFPPTRFGSLQKTQAVVRQQIANNVVLIRSVPQQYFDRIAQDVYDNITQAQRWETLADKLQDTLDYDAEITRSRANLIARDQTSKMNGAFVQDRQKSAGITHYMWQTAGDERVRPTHADNDGRVFAWDEPPEVTGHPGHDVNCRCVALAQFGELEEAA